VATRARAEARVAAWTARLIERIGPEEAMRLSASLLDTIDEVSQHRWTVAQQRAADAPGSIRPERVDAITASFSRELGLAGAAAGAAAMAPAVGTAATIATASAELAWFTARAGDLILTIAALHGMPDPSVDERRAWVLAVLIYGSSARDELARVLNRASTGLAPTTDGRLPLATLQMANRLMGRVLIRRYGARRGAVALGRLLPIGVGAAIGGSANYLTIRSLARQADAFFARLPYSAIDAESIDVTGRMVDPAR
jgi:hypothetical protein